MTTTPDEPNESDNPIAPDDPIAPDETAGSPDPEHEGVDEPLFAVEGEDDTEDHTGADRGMEP
jgi:hypothetical protein